MYFEWSLIESLSSTLVLLVLIVPNIGHTELKLQVKFQNPTTTPSGRKVLILFMKLENNVPICQFVMKKRKLGLGSAQERLV